MELPGPRLKAQDGVLPPEQVEVPLGWTVLEVVPVTSHAGWQVYAVLQELEPAPNLAQLIQAATEAPAGTAIGVPADMLREAIREIGYDVPEPSPLQPATMAEVSQLDRPRRRVKDDPQA